MDFDIKDFKVTPEMISAAKMVLCYTAQAESIKPIVKAYERKNLAVIQAKNDAGELITDPEQSYRMNDEDFKKYMELNEADRIKASLPIGNHEPGAGWCPLLIAEDDRRKAENFLIDAVYKAAPGQLLKSNASWTVKGEWVKPEYVKLCMKLVCSAANIGDTWKKPHIKHGIGKIAHIIAADYIFNKKHGLSLEPDAVYKNAFLQLRAAGLTSNGANLIIKTAMEAVAFDRM